ncbi:hypothetical protein JST97_08390 [bacterium]|nr:hypothetical protein [bacterium]
MFTQTEPAGLGLPLSLSGRFQAPADVLQSGAQLVWAQGGSPAGKSPLCLKLLNLF